ncbi:MAG TPA: hypothetical protein VGV59_15250 [Pyrinomonadaceae bacterium]|nr:hypothetical protein [Pyrinomonadaceae bacterium]
MLFAFILALSAVAGGALLTYFYDRESTLHVRLAAGACVGFAALGLFGFIISSVIGLTPLALLLSGLFVASPLALLADTRWRVRVRADVLAEKKRLRRALSMRDAGATGALAFYFLAFVLLWLVFAGAMYETTEGIYTSLDNNIGDLPFHTSIITSFLYGENFPPEHTEFAGVRLTYPFLVDFVAAMFVRAGASLEGALFWENMTLALALVVLLRRFALKLTGDRTAALFAPPLVLFNGGLGFVLLFREAWARGGGLSRLFGNLSDLLANLPHDYTILGQTYRWGNAITTLFIPQRSLLLGLSLVLIVLTVCWEFVAGGRRGEREATEHADGEPGGATKRKGKRRGAASKRAVDESRAREAQAVEAQAHGFDLSPMARMSAAGVVAGLLPLAHAHSFVVLLAMCGCIALIFEFERARRTPQAEGHGLRAWAAFFVVAVGVAAPQIIWATRESGMSAGSFFGWQFGWDKGETSFLPFWLNNAGLFIPLLVAALAWRGLLPRPLLLFYLPFALCFVVPNLFRLSPWVWDNIKVLFYWWVLSAPLVALLLARLWRSGAWLVRASALVMFAALIFSGALDVWRAVSGTAQHQTFDREGIEFAEMVKRTTPPRSLILHAPTYNHPVYLTGRRTLSGYEGHLWSHGLDYQRRAADLRRIYAGAPDAARLVEQYGIEYVVISPLEQTELARAGVFVNEQFFQNYQKVGEAGGYRLYKTARP